MDAAVLVLACQKGLSSRPKVCSSTDLQNMKEYLWRCPSTDASAAFEALLWQSMALDESHLILGKLPPFQTRVVSDLPSLVVLLD